MEKRKISDTLQALLDKAIVEPEFRWLLANDRNSVIASFGISEKNDLDVLDELLSSLSDFAMSVLSQNHGIKSDNYDYTKKIFRRRKPGLTYEEALEYTDGKK
jgi:hypothetical protein